MKSKISALLLIISIILSFSVAGESEHSEFSNILDLENIKKLKYMEISNHIEGKGKTALETAKYYFDNDGLSIEEKCTGDYGNGYFILKTDARYRPIYLETKYSSEIENNETDETYIYDYETGKITYIDRNKSKKKEFAMENIMGDSVSLGEMIVFMKLDKINGYTAKGMIVPGAMVISFAFKFMESKQDMINNEKIEEEIYTVQVNNLLLHFFASLLGKNTVLYLKKEFPHIKYKAEYNIRSVSLINHKIIYK